MPLLSLPSPPEGARRAFQVLPVELNQEIASYLRNDADLVHFRATCRDTKNSIDTEDSFWYKRFLEKYDPPIYATLTQGCPKYKELVRGLYQVRGKVMRTMVNYRRGQTNLEKACLRVILRMISDSFSGDVFVLSRDYKHQLYSNNTRILRQYVNRNHSSILDRVLIPSAQKERLHPLLSTVQVTLTAWCIRRSFGYANYSFESSQRAAYASPSVAPMFQGFNKQEVNMEWVLNVMNFFKYHITEGENATLSEPFIDLRPGEYPTIWQGRLRNGPSRPGKYWKGTYAYIEREEIKLMRSANKADQSHVFVDHNVDHGEEAIQTMSLNFPDEFPFPWPDVFENHLKSFEQPVLPRTRAQRSVDIPFQSHRHRFQASGWDNEDFSATGWLQTLPSQQGIPGWKRITMMKYFENDFGIWDEFALWAYEGVVLPGNQIIIGRWWSPEDDTPADEVYSGPFIFWNVDAHIEGTELHTELAGAPKKL